jgi:hypothetical protein
VQPFRTGRTLIALGVAATLLSTAGTAGALEPRAPIAIDNLQDPAFVDLSLDADAFTEFRLERIVLRNGQPVLTREVPLQLSGAQGIVHVAIPVDDGFGSLADGAYAQILRASGRRGGATHRLSISHLVHFRTQNGQFQRLSQQAYSDLVEPGYLQPGPQGEPVRVLAGAALARPRPAPGPVPGDIAIESGAVPGQLPDNSEQNEN